MDRAEGAETHAGAEVLVGVVRRAVDKGTGCLDDQNGLRDIGEVAPEMHGRFQAEDLHLVWLDADVAEHFLVGSLHPVLTDHDAYATGFMVMGLEDSRALVEATANMEALLIYQEDGMVKSYVSPGLRSMIKKLNTDQGNDQ